MNEFEEFYYKDATEHVYVYDHMPTDLNELGEMLVEWDALPEISRVMNNSFYFYGTYRRDGQHAEMLEKGNILKAYCENDTWQYFKISKANPNLETVSVTARPIAFEANNNFIEYMFVSNGSGQSIMDKIQSSLAFTQKVKYNAWNVSSLHQFTIKEAKPLEAIWGSNNGNINLANLVGGEVDFDNWTITLRDRIGEDSGYNIDFGVNLEAIESEIDDESVVNSLYLIGGTEENDYDEDKTPIKYKYLEVKGVNDSNRRIGKRENSECLTETDLKKWGQSLFDKDRIHEPKATHKISMVMLEYTEEYYKLYKTLGRLHFGDTAHVYNDKYNEYYEERMFEYVWYPTLKKYKSIVLGSAGQRYTASVQTETQKLQQKLENKTTMLVEAVRNATAWITGTKGGYVRFRPEKSPSEILIMDAPNVKDAKKVWRWNMGGLGFSSTGVDGPYGLAMTQDGAIVADFITTGVLRAIKIIGVTIQGSTFETINADGIHMTIAKGMVRFLNDSGKSLRSIDMINSDKPTLNIYNKSGNGNIGMGPDVLKIQHQKEIEFVAPVFRTQRIDANEIYINGQKVIPGQNGGPGSGGGTGTGGYPAEVTSSADKFAWDWRSYALENGYSKAAAAGILGNIQGEVGAGMNPDTDQAGGPAYGWVQWDGSAYPLVGSATWNGREYVSRLMDAANIKGGISTPLNQARLINWCLYNGQWIGQVNPTSVAGFKNATSPETAAHAFEMNFERPADAHPERQGWARAWYEKFKDLEAVQEVGSAGLAHLETLVGQRIGNGQCYAASAEYSGFLGGCGLGAGTRYGMTNLTGQGNTAAASDIGICFDWAARGWSVVFNPTYEQLVVGAIINFRRGALWRTWNTDTSYGHTGVIYGLDNGKIQTYEQNHEYGQIISKFSSDYPGADAIDSICYPAK